MNDLEYAARNVHDWPTEAKPGLTLGFRSCSDSRVTYIRVERNGSISCEIYKDQWLAERARLQNKPSWEDVPTQYSWYGQNASGKWDCFEYEPFANEHVNCWDFESGDALGLPNVGEVLGDWRDTLEPRPEEQTMTKKEWRGPEDGLPPVGTECEVKQGCKWHKTVIVGYSENFGSAVYESYGFGETVYNGNCTPSSFRPLRTEEDRAVEEIQRDGMGICHISEAGARALFKAGYRKQEPFE